jgi:PAS domain S-box-containing protein
MDALSGKNENINEIRKLDFTSSNGKFSSIYEYWGDGVVYVKSEGFLDDRSVQDLINFSEEAKTLFKIDAPYKLLWNISKVKNTTLLSRHKILMHAASNRYAAVAIIGANSMIRSFAAIVGKLIPRIHLRFFSTIEDAGKYYVENYHTLIHPSKLKSLKINTGGDSYSRFIAIWQENPQFMTIQGKQYKVLSQPSWEYRSVDGSYYVNIKVIEGNIVLYQCEGTARLNSINATYGILEAIMHDLCFNETDNKFYSILDLRKLKGITLSARRQTSHYESIYNLRAYFVIMVPSTFLQLILKLIKLVTSENFSHWKIAVDFDSAFDIVLKHRTGNTKSLQEQDLAKPEIQPLVVPKSTQELISLVRQQHEEIVSLKLNTYESIQKIVEIIVRMSWDEGFAPPKISNDSSNPFNEVFNSLSVLFSDFKEIINEKQRDNQKLLESEDKYRNLINLANDIILVFQDDQIKFVNWRVEQVLGYNSEDVLGKGMDTFVAVEDLPRLRDYYLRRQQGEELPWIYEASYLHKNGHRVPVSMSIGNVLYDNKPALMVIARDITQKKKTEEELDRYRNHLEEIIKQRTLQLQKEISERKNAEESDRLKTAFLSNMSHEIRTPMNAIISFSNYLKDRDISHEQREEYVGYIQSSGMSLLNLINDIIDISKIEAQQLRILESPFLIDTILGELYKYFEAIRIGQKKDLIKLILTTPVLNFSPTLKTDPYRIKQILSNLMDNALKFTDTGTIEFGYQLEDNSILFFVKDTGLGIPKDKQDIIFSRFGKIEASGRNISGTGLGLAISLQLAKLLHGELWVDSEKNKGSKFYLRLPYDSNQYSNTLKDIPEKQSNLQKTTWNDLTILIAEDEDLNFKVLEIALRKTGAQIERALNGTEAVEMAEKKKYDIILMDIQMPEMDGYKAMKLIKEKQPHIPILAQTAFALLDEQKLCLAQGFDDYLSKPIKIDELLYKIGKLLSCS